MHDVVCPALIGRDAQVASLRQLLGRARDGNGRVALIVGEAGVGKTRLLRELIDEARRAGFFVLQGACFEAERSIPYAPLLDLVRLFASGTSAAIVGKLHAATLATINTPVVKTRMREIGADLVTSERSSPDYLQRFVEAEIEKWAAPIRASGAVIE